MYVFIHAIPNPGSRRLATMDKTRLMAPDAEELGERERITLD